MEVIKKHEIDASEKDSNGNYEYYYEFDDFQFIENNVTFFARSYSDEPNEVSFRGVIKDSNRQMISTTDIQSVMFKQAVNHLKSEGKSVINVLTESGYEAINI